MNKVDVSVIIVNYNTFKLTCDCIQSVLENTKGVSYEIILVDNASVECDPIKFKELFPSIKLIASDTNAGFAKGNNVGIREAKGTAILLLNSDTKLMNDACEMAYRFLMSEDKIGVVSGKLVYPDGRVQHNCQRFPSISAQLFELFRMQKLFSSLGQKVLQGPFFKYDKTLQVDWVWGAFFMFKKEMLEQFPQKKLQEDFFMYCEDMQWCMEFRRNGFKTFFIPEPLIIHYMGGSGNSAAKHIAANTEVFMKKYYKPYYYNIFKILNSILVQ